MKVSKKVLPKAFEPFEIVIKIENENEFETLNTLVRNTSANGLKIGVEYHDPKPAKLLNLDILRVFLEQMDKALTK
jgi:hypothetical protein